MFQSPSGVQIGYKFIRITDNSINSFNHQAVYRLVICIWSAVINSFVSITKRCTDWLLRAAGYSIDGILFQSPSGVQIGYVAPPSGRTRFLFQSPSGVQIGYVDFKTKYSGSADVSITKRCTDWLARF